MTFNLELDNCDANGTIGQLFINAFNQPNALFEIRFSTRAEKNIPYAH